MRSPKRTPPVRNGLRFCRSEHGFIAQVLVDSVVHSEHERKHLIDAINDAEDYISIYQPMLRRNDN